MNPISDALSLPAVAWSDAVIDASPPRSPWSGLAQPSAALGVALDRVALARFDRYRDLLRDRNAQFNLTAIRDPDEIERRLFLDALAMAPVIDRIAGAGLDANDGDMLRNEASRLQTTHGRGERDASAAPQHDTVPFPADHQPTLKDSRLHLIDIGSGAGFPGLALKIARPHLDVTLVDATAKKVAFLDEVIAALELSGAQAVHGRAEVLGHDPSFRARYDLATGRAVASLPVLLEYVIPFLEVGGTALLPKGLEISEELRAGERAASRLGAVIVSAGQLPVAATRLVIAEKSAHTPAAYPRRAGLPQRHPLGEGI